MSIKSETQERREFFRVKFETPIQFKSYSSDQDPAKRSGLPSSGVSQDISQSGILFQTNNTPPEISSILWMHLDIRTLKICQEIEKRAIIFNDGLLGKVVRVEEDAKNQNVYEVGVCFLTQDQKDLREVKEALSALGPTQ